VKLYLIGSLRNPRVPEVARELRQAGFAVFDDWFSAGPDADDCWQAKQKGDGLSYKQALCGPAAVNVFEFDKAHLDAADVVVMLAPAGKSAHLELGYSIGQGKPGYVLMEAEPERWDVMYQFADGVAYNVEELTQMILKHHIFDDSRSDTVVG
jgi:nucleoside 2-deoxyribosyltransferase